MVHKCPKGSKWVQKGPNGPNRVQMGPKVLKRPKSVKRGQMGPNGSKRIQKGPKGFKRVLKGPKGSKTNHAYYLNDLYFIFFQIYFFFKNDENCYENLSSDQISYIDLDLLPPRSDSTGSTGSTGSYGYGSVGNRSARYSESSGSIGSANSVHYTTIDMKMTNAFNQTRKDVEKKRLSESSSFKIKRL